MLSDTLKAIRLRLEADLLSEAEAAKVGDVRSRGDGYDWEKKAPGEWVRLTKSKGKGGAEEPKSAAGGEGGEADGEKKTSAEKPAENGSKFLDVDPTADADGDGVADAARVGIPAKDVLPPPAIPLLPNLDPDERKFEKKFNKLVEENTKEMVEKTYEQAKNSKPNPWIFETDAAKNLLDDWTRPDLPPDEKVATGKVDDNGKPIVKAVVHPERVKFRARFNTPLHQAANALTKKAFLKRLDEIKDLPPEQKRVLVTCGGCAAGKGMGLQANPELSQGMAAVWDAAGEQNATENTWVLDECAKRGIRTTFLFVSADPLKAFDGAINRAKGAGRMVDAKAFADSYALGAKNHAAFAEQNSNLPDDDPKKANFVFVSYDHAKGGDPSAVTRLDKIPDEATSLDADEVYASLLKKLDSEKDKLLPELYKGASAGKRIWGKAS